MKAPEIIIIDLDAGGHDAYISFGHMRKRKIKYDVLHSPDGYILQRSNDADKVTLKKNQEPLVKDTLSPGESTPQNNGVDNNISKDTLRCEICGQICSKRICDECKEEARMNKEIYEKQTSKVTLSKQTTKKPGRSGKLKLTLRYSNYGKSVEGKGGQPFINTHHNFFKPGWKTSESGGGRPCDSRAEVIKWVKYEIRYYQDRCEFIPGPKTIILEDSTDLKFNINEFLTKVTLRDGYKVKGLKNIRTHVQARRDGECKKCEFDTHAHPQKYIEPGCTIGLCIRDWIAAGNPMPGAHDIVEINRKGVITSIR